MAQTALPLEDDVDDLVSVNTDDETQDPFWSEAACVGRRERGEEVSLSLRFDLTPANSDNVETTDCDFNSQFYPPAGHPLSRKILGLLRPTMNHLEELAEPADDQVNPLESGSHIHDPVENLEPMQGGDVEMVVGNTQGIRASFFKTWQSEAHHHDAEVKREPLEVEIVESGQAADSMSQDSVLNLSEHALDEGTPQCVTSEGMVEFLPHKDCLNGCRGSQYFSRVMLQHFNFNMK
jgi:hypothetical protein